MVPIPERVTSPRPVSGAAGSARYPDPGAGSSLQRHTLEVCPGQLDAMGPTIDTGRTERLPLPPPSPCDQPPKRRAEIEGRGQRRTFGPRDRTNMREGAARKRL